MRRILPVFFLLVSLPVVYPHDGYSRRDNIDVIHYQFAITVNDSTDCIEGKAMLEIRILKETEPVILDLMEPDGQGRGMHVTGVVLDDIEISWEHGDDRLVIYPNEPVTGGDTLQLFIEYNGIPADGLIISENKFGDRTFFTDHWPDRAHNYLPCVDHPYDKASVDFIITAPDKYRVVANGMVIEESDLPGDNSITRFEEPVPLAMKVMAFGVARFAVELAGKVNGIPVWSWVYPQNRMEGFNDYSVALKPLEYYCDIVGDYPFEKLANVQSRTIFGGMENAGAIFYSERSVTGNSSAEALIAHEIAHQWFGNSVTEADWHHIWLSEGFATYMTSLYFESIHGRERLESDMSSTREIVLEYYRRHPSPVVDTTVNDMMELLNPNSYQKGAWVLHMLRHRLGDHLFFAGLAEYYERYSFSNAMTSDFISVMEEVSEEDLSSFFHQWLYSKGHPELTISYEDGLQPDKKTVIIEQKQEDLFEFSLELMIKDSKGYRLFDIVVDDRTTRLDIETSGDPEIIPDPDVNLLFEMIPGG